MPATLEGQLVVAISSRALFDFEQENLVFEQGDDSAYMQLQLARLEQQMQAVNDFFQRFAEEHEHLKYDKEEALAA